MMMMRRLRPGLFFSFLFFRDDRGPDTTTTILLLLFMTDRERECVCGMYGTDGLHFLV
jgi:hypothetical protein